MTIQNYILILIAICFYVVFQDRNVSDYIVLRWKLFQIQFITKLTMWKLGVRIKYDNYIIQKRLKSLKKKSKE